MAAVKSSPLLARGGAFDVFNLPVTELPLIIDTRDQIEYENSHIVGAIKCSVTDEVQNAIGEDSWDNFNTVCVYGSDETVVVTLATWLSEHGISIGINAVIPQKILIVTDVDEILKTFPFLFVRNCAERFSADSVLCNPDNELFTPTIIRPGLFLSSDDIAANYNIIELLSIDTIINVTNECKNHHQERDKGINYLQLKAIDQADYDMTKVWFQAAEAIHTARSHMKTVLVHCHAGKSRSASTIIYYLMKHEGKTFDQAFNYVKSCRPSINPNYGFIAQLQSCE